jgi:ABC-2 type transport system permease protein
VSTFVYMFINFRKQSRAGRRSTVCRMIETGIARGRGRPLPAGVLAEWTKIRTLRSTTWSLALTFVFCVGLGYAAAASLRADYPRMPAAQQAQFDPLFATFYSLTLGQLPLVVFGVLVIGGEYGSGTICGSLIATPRRGRFFACKLLATTAVMLGLAPLTVLATFAAAQAGLAEHATSPTAPGVLSASCGACAYLMLICLFALGVATALRSTAKSLGLLIPLLFLDSQGLGNIPKFKTVAQYLPDQAGSVALHIAGPQSDPRWHHDYGPWTGLAILALWAAAALVCGHVMLERRDAR